MQVERAQLLANENGKVLEMTQERVFELRWLPSLGGDYIDEIHPTQLAEMDEDAFVEFYLI